MAKRRNVAADARAALLEMAEDLRGTGLMSEGTYQKITMDEPDPSEATIPSPSTGSDIQITRE